jgi:uncharacterized protein YkwD
VSKLSPANYQSLKTENARGYKAYSGKAPSPTDESPKKSDYQFESIWETPPNNKVESKPSPPPKPSPRPKEETPKPKPQEPAPQANPRNGFDSDCLSTHNRYRSIEGAPALTWDESLARQARDHAREMAQRRQMAHRGSGENLYQAYGNGLSCTAAVNSWYSEKNEYTPGTKIGEGKFEEYGHYTQVSLIEF